MIQKTQKKNSWVYFTGIFDTNTSTLETKTSKKRNSSPVGRARWLSHSYCLQVQSGVSASLSRNEQCTLSVHCELLNSNQSYKCECVVEFLLISWRRLCSVHFGLHVKKKRKQVSMSNKTFDNRKRVSCVLSFLFFKDVDPEINNGVMGKIRPCLKHENLWIRNTAVFRCVRFLLVIM